MADLATLDGISKARNDLYSKLESGEISEARALAQERVLRGQSELKATIPLRLLSIIAKAKNPGVSRHGEALMRSLIGFVNGPEALVALDAQGSQEMSIEK